MSSLGVTVTSTGNEGVDAAVGGGLPLGSLTVLVEDFPTAHYDYFVRIFLAQGLAHGHAVALAQLHAPPAGSFAALPKPRVDNESDVATASDDRNIEVPDVNIAWRYTQGSAVTAMHNIPSKTVNGGAEDCYRHTFDLSDIFTLDSTAPISHLGYGSSRCLGDMMRDIAAHIRSSKLRNRLARVAVVGLQSALWEESILSVPAFVHHLKVLAERSQAVLLVTVPGFTASDAIYREADIVLKLDTFGGRGAEVAGLGSDWLGVLSIEKPFRPCGTLKTLDVNCYFWVFKRSRRKYVVEPAAAAPELDDAEAFSKEHGSSAGRRHDTLRALGSCSTTGSLAGQLDF